MGFNSCINNRNKVLLVGMATLRHYRCQLICLLMVLYSLCSDSCEPWQVKRNNLCCIPVFNCEPGTEVGECEVSGRQERCSKCPDGTVQPDLVNSYSENRKCFKSETSCSASDLTPTNVKRNGCVPQYCKCNKNRCFYENICTCYRANPCGVGETLNTKTGGCEVCKAYEYKDKTGCGPCLVNTTAWMALKGYLDTNTKTSVYSIVTKHPQREEFETSSPTKQSSCNDTQTDISIYFILAVIFGILSIVIAIISVLSYIFLKRKYRTSNNNKDRQKNEEQPLQDLEI